MSAKIDYGEKQVAQFGFDCFAMRRIVRALLGLSCFRFELGRFFCKLRQQTAPIRLVKSGLRGFRSQLCGFGKRGHCALHGIESRS